MRVVVFGALAWCGPCRALHRVIEKYKKDHPEAADRIEFKDVDDSANLELAKGHGISSIPAMVKIKDEDEFMIPIDFKKAPITAQDFEDFMKGVA